MAQYHLESFPPLSETSVVLNQGWFCFSQRVFWFSQLGRGAAGIWYAQTRDVDVHPTLRKAASTMKNYLAPNVNRTKAEKP